MKTRSLLALFALVALSGLVLMGAKATTEFVVKDAATAANPDTAIAGADTSSAISISEKVTKLYVTVTADTTTIYTTQVSPDGGAHWYTVDVDTTAATNCIESTADLGDKYAGWDLRVIQTSAAAKSFGRATVVQIQ
jgi:hypothetical protein